MMIQIDKTIQARRALLRTRKIAGFSLIELLVVLAIMLILVAVLLSALAASRQRTKVVLAAALVKEIAAAAARYYEDLRCYPPDTDPKYGEANAEPRAIHRYLGMRITDKAGGKTYGPYIDIRNEFLKGPFQAVDGVANVGLYVDSWGNPFQLDAMHVTVNTTTGVVTRVGEPYAPGTLDKDKLLDVKVWSYGPDGKNNLGSQADNGKGTGVDADNVTSWAD